ncbi:hypothetical protein SAMN05444164_7570 [Bradyrhizobium erythrophlei]|uniref:Uncharacterized protein n=1 Tax=Bradyrhizobium erythrophlei TaxID=1437360 RepID=A0A1H5HNF0_9BRAD|nr:hypothetical protein SAMN05444164_7570 [Bradyrhizobium erythrophlei]
MLAPIRLGADFARDCSETEQFDGCNSARAEIWIFDCLIYDRENRAKRESDPKPGYDQEEFAKQRLREEL